MGYFLNAGFFIMLIREWIGKAIISGMIFSLGFLWILFDRDNQGWHDKLVSTYVVDQKRVKRAAQQWHPADGASRRS